MTLSVQASKKNVCENELVNDEGSYLPSLAFNLPLATSPHSLVCSRINWFHHFKITRVHIRSPGFAFWMFGWKQRVAIPASSLYTKNYENSYFTGKSIYFFFICYFGITCKVFMSYMGIFRAVLKRKKKDVTVIVIIIIIVVVSKVDCCSPHKYV